MGRCHTSKRKLTGSVCGLAYNAAYGEREWTVSWGAVMAIQRYRPDLWSMSVLALSGSEPITSAEVRDQLNYIGTDKDGLIDFFIAAAREEVEGVTRRAIRAQTRLLSLSRFPEHDDEYVALPGGKIRSVTSIAYVDDDGADQSFSSFMTELGSDDSHGRIFLSDGASWPDVRERGLPVKITYEAGYDPSATAPQGLLIPMKMRVADLFENREAQTERMQDNPAFMRILSRYIIWEFG